MFPLRDDIPSQRFPVVTLMLIALNVVSFLFELSLGPNLQDCCAVWLRSGTFTDDTTRRNSNGNTFPNVNRNPTPKPEPGRIA